MNLTIGAMNQDVDTFLETSSDEQGCVQNGVNVSEPAARLDTVNEGGHGRSLELASFQQFRQATTHYVNILNAAKLELDVFIEVLIFVAFSSRSVGHCVDLVKRDCIKFTSWMVRSIGNCVSAVTHSWPGIYDVHELGIGIGLYDTVQ